jgi:hypothetical protein
MTKCSASVEVNVDEADRPPVKHVDHSVVWCIRATSYSTVTLTMKAT